MSDDRFSQFIKRYAFWEGALLGALICSLLYERFRIDTVKEGASTVRTRYDILKDSYEKAATFEPKYEHEQLARREAETKLTLLSNDFGALTRAHSLLLGQKWEEKYRAERLSRERLETEFVAATNQLAVAAVAPKQTPLKESTDCEALRTKLDALEQERESIQAKIQALERERDSLRLLYSGTTTNSPETRTTGGGVNATALLLSLDGLSYNDVAGVVIDRAPHVDGGIPPAIFIKMLEQASILSRGQMVEKCAKYIHRPISPVQYSAISKLLSPSQAASAVKVLNMPAD